MYGTNENNRLDKVIDTLIQYSHEHSVDEDAGKDKSEDLLNSVLPGLNVLGEELDYYRQQLGAKTALLDNIFQNIDEIVYAIRIDESDLCRSRHEFISQNVMKKLGYSDKEIYADAGVWFGAIHPDDLAGFRQAAAKIAKGETITCTYRIKNKDTNAYIWLEDHMVPKVGENGVVLQVFCCARDITPQQETYEELCRINKLNSRIIETSDQFFYVITFDETNPLGNVFSYASQQVEKINGSTIEDIRGNPLMWFQQIHPDDRKTVLDTNRQMFKTGVPATRVYRTRHYKTGQYVWVEDYVCPVVDDNGRVIELYGSARAITERKEAEEKMSRALRELQLLDKINAAALKGLSFQELTSRMLDAYSELCGSRANRAYIYNQKENKLYLTAQSIASNVLDVLERKTGIKINSAVPCLDRDNCFTKIFASGKAVITSDDQEIEALMRAHTNNKALAVFAPWAKKYLGIKTFGVLPLSEGDKVFGLATFYTAEQLTEDEKDTIIRFTKQVTSILAKAKAEEELKEQRAFTDHILNSIPADIAIYDAKHRYMFVTPHAVKDEQMRSWLIGKDDFDYCKEKGISNALARRRRLYFKEAVTTRKEVEWIDEQQDKKGNRMFMLRRLYPFYHQDELKYVIGYGTDITMLKNTELKLSEQESYLRTLVKSLPDIIIRTDKDGRLLDYKAGIDASRMDKRLQQIMGKTLRDVWQEKADYHLYFINKALTEKKLHSYEYSVTNQAGEPKVFEVRVKHSMRDEVIMIVRDITEKKKAEEEKEKLIEELRDRYNELMQFNYIVSHNMRAPVAHILGMCDILEMPIDEQDRDQALGYIVQAARAMDGLIKDLNTILSSKSTLSEKVEAFLLSDMIGNTIKNLEMPIRSAGAVINIDITPEADSIMSIKSYLQSAIYNLVSNALKYKRPDVAPVIQVRVWRDNNAHFIQVTDNGIGIDIEKYGNEIFGLYKRFHVGYEGKGLGLHMTKTQIESIRGNITVSSTPGEGSTFVITLR